MIQIEAANILLEKNNYVLHRRIHIAKIISFGVSVIRLVRQPTKSMFSNTRTSHALENSTNSVTPDKWNQRYCTDFQKSRNWTKVQELGS